MSYLTRMRTSYLLVLLSLFLVASCAVNPYYDPDKPHHTPNGFQNIDHANDKGFLAFIKWRWERLFTTIPSAEEYDFPVNRQGHDLLIDNPHNVTLTWIGHATFLLQFGELNILTDPHFSQRASPLSWIGPKRAVPPAPALEALPEIDVVVISHDHYDSLDVDTLRALSRHNRQRPLTYLVPLGLKAWFEDLDLPRSRVVELDWGQSHPVSGVTFSAEPSQHWSKRSLFDANRRLWASWVMEYEGKHVFFAGDTGYSRLFRTIGEKYDGFELALIPIGAYEPRWFMRDHHVNPDEAVKIHQDIRSRYSVAMHWGTFILTDEPLDEPPLKLQAALRKYNIPENDFPVFQHGQVQVLDWLFAESAD